jgi:phospholipid transport system substrate-binding protein
MSRFGLLFLLFSFVLPGTGAAAEDLASALVRSTSDRMLSTLEAKRKEIDQRPELIYQLVGQIVVPHFDFTRITQAAVGRYWRDATPQQRGALSREFEQLLVRTYAKALLAYSGQQIIYLPLRPGHDAGDVTVATAVQEPGAPSVPINYRLYLKDGAWKVYDVIIDNVSLIANYRSSFASQIRRDGIDGLIKMLRDLNAGGRE